MDPDDDSSKIRSLEHDQLEELFDEEKFPISTREVIDRYGDVEIHYPHDDDTLKAILEASGGETYQNRNQLELAVLNGVGRGAVGRPRYSDRALERDDRERDPKSF